MNEIPIRPRCSGLCVVHCRDHPVPAGGWDPVPHLAQLIDALHTLARHGGNENLGALLTGPYAALRGGLLLDEPGRETVTAEDAIREALAEAPR